MTKIVYTVDTIADSFSAQAHDQACGMLGVLLDYDKRLRAYIKYKEDDKNTDGMILARKMLYMILNDYHVTIHDWEE